MRASLRTAELAEIADLNPTIGESLRDEDRVSFIPMSAVDAETATTDDSATRCYAEVSKGYTSFLDGDVLVAKITPCFENGKIAQARLIRRVGFGSTEFHVIRPHPNQADPRYVLHFLRRDRIRLEGERKMTGSAGQRRVPEHFLAQLRLPLPPLTEQRRIAEVLDRAEALRAKRRAALVQLDTLTKTIFLDMFGDPATNPKDWPVTQLAELCEAVIDCPHATPTYSVGRTEYPCIRSSDIQDGYFDFSDTKYVDRSEYEKRIVRGKPQVGDVVYCREGARLGNAARITQEISLCLGQRTMLFRPNRTAAVSEYLWAFLLTPAAYKCATRLVGGSASPHLNIRDIIAFRVPRPPIDVQREFARRVAATEALKEAYHSSLAYSDTLFASLQHRAFRGDL